MKSAIVFITMNLLVQSALAGAIPVELKNLLPVGKDERTFRGKTLDGKECSFDVFSAKGRFSASVSVYDGHGNLINSVKFLLGNPNESVEQKNIGSTVNYENLIQQQDPDKDLRLTLKLHKEGKQLKAVQILREEESYIGFSTLDKETCYLQ